MIIKGTKLKDRNSCMNRTVAGGMLHDRLATQYSNQSICVRAVIGTAGGGCSTSRRSTIREITECIVQNGGRAGVRCHPRHMHRRIA